MALKRNLNVVKLYILPMSTAKSFQRMTMKALIEDAIKESSQTKPNPKLDSLHTSTPKSVQRMIAKAPIDDAIGQWVLRNECKQENHLASFITAIAIRLGRLRMHTEP
jgi:uncharacterized protein YfaA (DUF2138 family)